MKELKERAESVAALLIARRQTLSVSESSSGGLISAALLSIPGASAYFYGGAVIYTARARAAFLHIERTEVVGMRGATAPYAALLAARTRGLMRTHWAIAETGAAGPAGNPYGDAAGHSCIAVDGPIKRLRVVATGLSDRDENMRLFAAAALDELAEALQGA